MLTFQALYRDLVRSAANGQTKSEPIQTDGYDPHQLDCLLNPGKHALVWGFGDCGCPEQESSPCVASCLFDAIKKDETGSVIIDRDLCVGCSECIAACRTGKLTASRDVLPVLEAVKNAAGPVYAMIAPAFIGQFEADVTPGKLRSAFKQIGFTGMVEVALFADILTLREALEFDQKILAYEDFMLTSCCCPVWIAMIKKVYRQFVRHVSGSVSPMVACGRSIKYLEPTATTVFIGPCIAKKAEAREPDVADAVDFVLTFEETRDIFDAFQMELTRLPNDDRDHASRAGRIYARTGGVSEAVGATVRRLNPERAIAVRARQADGVPACKEMLGALKEGRVGENFLEGMGCPGGCVGGPKAIRNREEGRENVNEYAALANFETPLDNPYVLELLKQLEVPSVESLLTETELFTRQF